MPACLAQTNATPQTPESTCAAIEGHCTCSEHQLRCNIYSWGASAALRNRGGKQRKPGNGKVNKRNATTGRGGEGRGEGRGRLRAPPNAAARLALPPRRRRVRHIALHPAFSRPSSSCEACKASTLGLHCDAHVAGCAHDGSASRLDVGAVQVRQLDGGNLAHLGTNKKWGHGS